MSDHLVTVLKARRTGLLIELEAIDAVLALYPDPESSSAPEATDSGAAAASRETIPSSEDMPPPPAAPTIDEPLTEDEVEYLEDMEALENAGSAAAPAPPPPPADKRFRDKPAGRVKQFLDWLEERADEGRELPATHSMAQTEAGVPKGSQGYVKDQILLRGFAEWLSPDDGRWGIRLKDGRELYSPAPTKPDKPARVRDGTYATRTPTGEPKAARRFTDKKELDPESVTGLADDHPAVTEGRTLFPTTVVDPADSPRLLVSGQNSRKLGSHVTKGPWKGFPIYSLTLEERATCPRSCHAYSTCYGNGMPFARRHKHGPALEARLDDELQALSRDHPAGFVVRLHQLGDFYSNDYVTSWWLWLNRIEPLHVFGYTAHDPESKIGLAVSELNKAFADRCAIRYSSANSLPNGATVIDYLPTTPKVPEGLVCPAQLGRTESCGTCGLCWHPNARDKTIVFVRHGPKFEGRTPGDADRKAEHLPRVKAMLEDGKTNAQIAIALGVGLNTVGAYRKELGIPGRGGRKPARAPKKPAYQRAIVPSTVDEVAEANLDVTFPAPMQRRCPRCNNVFDCRNLNEVICPTCSSTHARSNGAATTHGGVR